MGMASANYPKRNNWSAPERRKILRDGVIVRITYGQYRGYSGIVYSRCNDINYFVLIINRNKYFLKKYYFKHLINTKMVFPGLTTCNLKFLKSKTNKIYSFFKIYLTIKKIFSQNLKTDLLNESNKVCGLLNIFMLFFKTLTRFIKKIFITVTNILPKNSPLKFIKNITSGLV